MTPQSKANQLFNKMYKYQLDKSNPISWQLAKKCALIAVDEIVSTDMLIDEDVYVDTVSYLGFWEEVKRHLQKI